MDKGLATIIAGSIAGVVGLVSMLFSLFSMKAQATRQRLENEKQREHQVRIETAPRLLESIEKAWMILFKIQSGDAFTQPQIDEVIGSTIWLPSEIRNDVLTHLQNKEDENYRNNIPVTQTKLLSLVDSIKLKDN